MLLTHHPHPPRLRIVFIKTFKVAHLFEYCERKSRIMQVGGTTLSSMLARMARVRGWVSADEWQWSAIRTIEVDPHNPVKYFSLI